MVFPNADSLKKAIKEHVIKTHRNIRLLKNDKVRIRARCADGCPWTLFASVDSATDSWVIKTLNEEQSCQLEFSNKVLDGKWLCEKYLNKFRAQPTWSFAGFKQQVNDDTQIDISKWQFYRARKLARAQIDGSTKEQYSRLWDYCAELRRANPGSTVKMKCYPQATGEVNPKFQRLYVCMAATKNGFLAGCRRIIGLDGCFLKGPHKGQLLAAVSVDANNSIYPIAYAVVESECYDTWVWFLEFLLEDLDIGRDSSVTWISDRQKGLLESIRTLCGEEVQHRFCVRHLYNNFKANHKGLTLKIILWAAAKSTIKPR